jgi:hypothetical protein
MLSLIKEISQLIENNNLLYFFSALAQCAAAFAALVGVFAVFRLQANTTYLADTFLEAKYWLSLLKGSVAYQLPSVEIKKELENLDQDGVARQDLRPRAVLLRKHIGDIEAFSDRLPLELSKILKIWTAIFILALTMCGFTKLYEKSWSAIVVLAVFLIGVIFAVMQTASFIQKCLGQNLQFKPVKAEAAH